MNRMVQELMALVGGANASGTASSGPKPKGRPAPGGVPSGTPFKRQEHGKAGRVHNGNGHHQARAAAGGRELPLAGVGSRPRPQDVIPLDDHDLSDF